MLVELDIFSGRPNPRWELDEHDRGELLRLQAGLTASDQAPREPPGLGYRGFFYAIEAGTCHAFHGHVRTAAAVLADPEFSVERFLLGRLPAEFASLREGVLATLV